ncbi:hypothetical protein T08_6510 [Trichinella sp. T8]|nr:hypothetical protein T08_6510 [Trichinella sp. T8]
MNINNEKTTHLALIELSSAYYSVHTVLRHKLQFILSKKFQCTKTGFQRCAMQITIAIKGALSSVRAHSFV